MEKDDSCENGFEFKLSPAFWTAVRAKVEDINRNGGNLDLHEDFGTHLRTFLCEGDHASVSEMARFVQKMSMH